MLNAAAGSVSQCAYQCLPVGCEPNWRWAAAVLLVGQCAASVEEFVFLHDVQTYRQTRCQNSRCKFGAPLSWAWLLERHRPAGGTATPAGVPIGSSVRRPVLVVSESLECAGGILREDSWKGSFLQVCVACNTSCSRSLSMAMLTSVETSSGIRFGGAWTDLTAGSLGA